MRTYLEVYITGKLFSGKYCSVLILVNTIVVYSDGITYLNQDFALCYSPHMQMHLRTVN